MNIPAFSLRSAVATASISLMFSPALFAQTDAVVVQQDAAPTVVQTAPVPGEHVADIEISVSKGSVQAYFGRAPRKERLEIGSAQIDIKMPSTATVTKLASRDKDSPGSKRVTPDNPWIARVPFNGPGRYVFNIVEWDDDPVVTSAVVRVDGAVLFSGRGSEDDFNGWAQKTYGPNVTKSGSREIAFIVP